MKTENRNSYYLSFNDIDGRWKVLSVKNDGVIGSGKTIAEAVESARCLTNKPIFTDASCTKESIYSKGAIL